MYYKEDGLFYNIKVILWLRCRPHIFEGDVNISYDIDKKFSFRVPLI
jgi:hypothetical protein